MYDPLAEQERRQRIQEWYACPRDTQIYALAFSILPEILIPMLANLIKLTPTPANKKADETERLVYIQLFDRTLIMQVVNRLSMLTIETTSVEQTRGGIVAVNARILHESLKSWPQERIYAELGDTALKLYQLSGNQIELKAEDYQRCKFFRPLPTPLAINVSSTAFRATLTHAVKAAKPHCGNPTSVNLQTTEDGIEITAQNGASLHRSVCPCLTQKEMGTIVDAEALKALTAMLPTKHTPVMMGEVDGLLNIQWGAYLWQTRARPFTPKESVYSHPKFSILLNKKALLLAIRQAKIIDKTFYLGTSNKRQPIIWADNDEIGDITINLTPIENTLPADCEILLSVDLMHKAIDKIDATSIRLSFNPLTNAAEPLWIEAPGTTETAMVQRMTPAYDPTFQPRTPEAAQKWWKARLRLLEYKFDADLRAAAADARQYINAHVDQTLSSAILARTQAAADAGLTQLSDWEFGTTPKPKELPPEPPRYEYQYDHRTGQTHRRLIFEPRKR